MVVSLTIMVVTGNGGIRVRFRRGSLRNDCDDQGRQRCDAETSYPITGEAFLRGRPPAGVTREGRFDYAPFGGEARRLFSLICIINGGRPQYRPNTAASLDPKPIRGVAKDLTFYDLRCDVFY
ncbi:hypothetical protein EVAR_47285_1 [Eumeta japonica]|uniref:Uncharacterized protein n=1 Tax=Eumeta variegata TaxID=151549 RepID=A0A4C1Z1S9_EUMVA|nr:hypothetical protein EVAR_47285_1 [Eumeta japonica]